MFTGWGPVRWLRLGLAGALLMAGIASGDMVAYGGAAFFALQAVLNFGCCAAACPTGSNAAKSTDGANIVYEEVRK
ncbi:MAG: hypothetical protein RBT71_09930 [Flavobacteriales bacterium]|nr:hypothetical protein [Flavobacteriales bacterium]